jgi:hypothetical protein
VQEIAPHELLSGFWGARKSVGNYSRPPSPA